MLPRCIIRFIQRSGRSVPEINVVNLLRTPGASGGLAVPEVRSVRHRLVPELPVASSRAGGAGEELTFGVADGVALGDDGRVHLVVDWKSDVDPAAEAVTRYRGQVRAYLDATGAPAGLIVFLSSGRVVRVERVPG